MAGGSQSGMGPLEIALYSRSAGLPDNTQKALRDYSNQQALAQSLLQQGITPIDTSNRQIGGVAYKISPWEGVAKLAQALSGAYGENQANQNLSDVLSQPSSGQGDQGGVDPVVQAMPTQTQALYNRLMMPESMGGNPRAGVDLYKTFAGGMTAYQTGVGAAGAANAPVGAAAPGMPGYQPPSQQQPTPQQGSNPQQSMAALPPITPVSGPQQLPPPPPSPMQMNQSDIQNALPKGIALDAPNPAGGIADMPTPLPGESNAQYKSRLEAGQAGASSQATEEGKNLADAKKTLDVAYSALPRAMQRFETIRQAAPIASYSGGVSDGIESENSTLLHHIIPADYARDFARTSVGGWLDNKIVGLLNNKPDADVAAANQAIEQAASQGILSELGPQLQGLKGNRFVEMMGAKASGLNPADPPDTKIKAVNGLQDQYISNMKALADQLSMNGVRNVPSDLDMAQLIAQHAGPSQNINVIDPNGKPARIPTYALVDLIKEGGKLR